MSNSFVQKISMNFLNKTLWRRFPVRQAHSYEGDGKTSVTILNHEVDSPLMIDSYSQVSLLTNNYQLILISHSVFHRLGSD